MSFIVNTDSGVQKLKYRVAQMGHTSSGDVWVHTTDKIFMDNNTQRFLHKQMDDLLIQSTGAKEHIVEEMAGKLSIVAEKAQKANVVFYIMKMECSEETTFSISPNLY